MSGNYILLDDYSSAGGGGGTGQPLGPEFNAPTIAAAVQVAYLFASIYQRPIRLAVRFGGPQVQPWTLVTGALAQVALTSVPSGVSF